MNITELVVIAVGLSMDAFAVAICKGLSMKKLTFASAVIVGGWFGAFQGLMPAAGYLLGASFAQYVEKFDHYIAFILLMIIGINMIRESRHGGDGEDRESGSLSVTAMLPLAVATSIDALAVGVTFSFLKVNIWFAAVLIAAVTFFLSAAGVWVGKMFGAKYKSAAELTGGVVLCIIGTRILLEHLGVFEMLGDLF